MGEHLARVSHQPCQEVMLDWCRLQVDPALGQDVESNVERVVDHAREPIRLLVYCLKKLLR
jgi:hypothetical protein